MKTNKEFYEALLKYESEGKLLFMPKRIPSDFFKINMYKKNIALHTSLIDFSQEIKDKVDSHNFFTQRGLEMYINKSLSYVNRLVRDGEYIRLIEGQGLKFYLKKDWED